MIDETQLRIGNLVNTDYGIGKVHAVGHRGCEVWTKEGYIPNATWAPIPLTPEILEKAGFEKNNRCWYKSFTREYDKLDSAVWVAKSESDPVNMWYSGFDSPVRSVAINNIYFLHQLQNLYHALTGTELTINL